MEKELPVQNADTAEAEIADAASADLPENTYRSADESTTPDATGEADADTPDGEELLSEEMSDANGKIALQALIAEGVKAVLAEMGLIKAEFQRDDSGIKPRFGGVTGGANPPPRAEEDDFMRGFREV